jgi:hypothetical protein
MGGVTTVGPKVGAGREEGEAAGPNCAATTVWTSAMSAVGAISGDIGNNGNPASGPIDAAEAVGGASVTGGMSIGALNGALGGGGAAGDGAAAG